MRPENVQVSVPERNKKSQNYTISWNGTNWPSSTVFVVMAKKHQKGLSSGADTANDWTEIKQVHFHLEDGILHAHAVLLNLFKDPVLPIILHTPLLLFWCAQERGFYCSEACEA